MLIKIMLDERSTTVKSCLPEIQATLKWTNFLHRLFVCSDCGHADQSFVLWQLDSDRLRKNLHSL